MTVGSSTQFIEGWVTFFTVLGGSRWVWWGRNEVGEDYLGTVGGRVAVCETADDVMALVQSCGWGRNAHLETDDGSRLDFRSAQWWVRGRGPFDADAAINLWNFSEDVLRSTSGNALTTGPASGALHAHLTETALPWLARGGKPPAWSAHELRRLRSVLERADRTASNALLAPPVHPSN